MKALLALIVILLLTTTLWVLVGGLPLRPLSTEAGTLRAEVPRESAALPDPEADSSGRALAEAEGMIRYRLVDAETGEALPDSEIYSLLTEKLAAKCDEDGEATLDVKDPGQLLYRAEGYLPGFFLPDRELLLSLRKQAESRDVTVELYRDEISFPLEFDFRLPNGEPAEDIEYTLRMSRAVNDPRSRRQALELALHGQSEGLRRAWNSQRNMPKIGRSLALMPIQPINNERFKSWSVRLFRAGFYRVVAVTAEGDHVQQEVWIGPETQRLTVDLAPGGRISGQTLNAVTGKPVSPARVRLNRGPFGQAMWTDCGEEGRFSIVTFGSGPEHLWVEARGYENLRLDEINPGLELAITLAPLPRMVLRGRVLARGSRAPIADAVVKSFESETRTDDEGVFVLDEVHADSDFIHIEADGYYPSGSALAKPAASARPDFSLIPDQPGARVAAGITSLLSGKVQHPGGKIAAGMDLRLGLDDSGLRDWRRSQRNTRRLDRNGLFVTPGQVTCDADGRFTIECGRPGSVSLRPMDGESLPFKIQVALGRNYENLVIHTKH